MQPSPILLSPQVVLGQSLYFQRKLKYHWYVCWHAGMGLQVVAMQQIHPLVRFVSGYVRGVEMACSATGNLLGRCAALLVSGCLPGSKALAGGSSRMMGKKGKLLLKLLRALPFVMHSFAQSLGAAGLIRL